MSDQRPPKPIESRAVATTQRNIRIDDALWSAVVQEANRQGTTAAQFVREAMAFRLGVIAAIEHGQQTREIEAMLRRILERAPEA